MKSKVIKHYDILLVSQVIKHNDIYYIKVSFIILRHCRTHWPWWLRAWGGESSLTKMLVSQSPLCVFASAFTLITLALCVKCQRTLKGTLLVWVHVSLFLFFNQAESSQLLVEQQLSMLRDVRLEQESKHSLVSQEYQIFTAKFMTLKLSMW